MSEARAGRDGEVLVYSGEDGFRPVRDRAAPAPVAPATPERAAPELPAPEPGAAGERGWVARMAAGMIERTLREATNRFRDELDRYVDEKRTETLEIARQEAHLFVDDSVSKIERRIDRKLAEIEARIDEQLEKELATKFRILILTLLTVIAMSLLSLAYFWIKKGLGLPT